MAQRIRNRTRIVVINDHIIPHRHPAQIKQIDLGHPIGVNTSLVLSLAILILSIHAAFQINIRPFSKSSPPGSASRRRIRVPYARRPAPSRPGQRAAPPSVASAHDHRTAPRAHAVEQQLPPLAHQRAFAQVLTNRNPQRSCPILSVAPSARSGSGHHGIIRPQRRAAVDHIHIAQCADLHRCAEASGSPAARVEINRAQVEIPPAINCTRLDIHHAAIFPVALGGRRMALVSAAASLSARARIVHHRCRWPRNNRHHPASR